MSISVLTRSYNNARPGANPAESVLTAAAVRSRGIRRLFSLPLPGDRRGAEAQPLIVPGVALPGGRTRDLWRTRSSPSMPMMTPRFGSTRLGRRSPARAGSTSIRSRPLGHSFDACRRCLSWCDVRLRLDEPGRFIHRSATLASCVEHRRRSRRTSAAQPRRRHL